ncbi:hypothetical protein HNI00_12980 [Thermoleptolyngbya oregonensis NK1-22]|uniref:Uncharacterized protein n=1 Tax=Thermoleptolyngbya oregonensis NK1-22 TaxID=2547457 RepID=A0AA97BA79_9CYAN|nr:hypothetical protein [Thermoleptolyngbya oregonensis]WOB43960.1 hypothetical protein HNI00_12980 [Thermoleptolyngbya oregonensis NK1-22]
MVTALEGNLPPGEAQDDDPAMGETAEAVWERAIFRGGRADVYQQSERRAIA